MTQQGTPPPVPPYAPPPGYELKRRKPFYARVWFWLAVIVVLVVVAVATSSSGKGGGGSSSGTVHVVYAVTSDASTVMVTYATVTGGQLGEQQDTHAAPPWSKALDVADSWVKSFTVTASMVPAALGGGPRDGTTIGCTITVGGKVVAQQTSQGQGATVTCASAG